MTRTDQALMLRMALVTGMVPVIVVLVLPPPILQPASDCLLCSDEGAEHGGNARLTDGDLACQATLGQEKERGDAAKERAENDAGHGREVSPAYRAGVNG